MRFGGIILAVASQNILISSKRLVIIAFMWFVDDTQVGMYVCDSKTVILRQNKAYVFLYLNIYLF